MVDISTMLSGKGSQLNADDLKEEDRIITITRVERRDGEQPLAIHFEGDNGKPFLPCLTMRRVIAHLWGTNGSVFVGRRLHLYRDASVTFGKESVGGIRIKGASHITGLVTCLMTVSRGKRRRVTIQPLAAPQDERARKSADLFVADVKSASNEADLEKITSGDKAVKLRNYLREKLPDLAADVDKVVQEKLASFEAGQQKQVKKTESSDDLEVPAWV